jgi:hypothetical protein
MRARQGRILSDLVAERFNVRKTLFGAKEIDEPDFPELPVKVAAAVEKMHFEGDLWV